MRFEGGVRQVSDMENDVSSGDIGLNPLVYPLQAISVSTHRSVTLALQGYPFT